MNKTSQPTKEEFDALLNWFSPNRRDAGEEYEQIRRGLVRFFRFRGCSDPSSLADETLNRVAIKLQTLDLTKNVKKISIFYGFAFNVFREYLNRVAKKEVQLDSDYQFEAGSNGFSDKSENGSKEKASVCLEWCLQKLPKSERSLLIRYYSEEKSKKIEIRKRMAEELDTRANTLHVKIHRQKKVLKECVKNCLKKENV